MGLPVVRTGNTALDRFLEQVREYIESSRGGTGTAAQNRVLRVSDISSIVQLAAAGAAKSAKSFTQSEMEGFAAGLADTRLFQSLTGPGSALGGAVDGLPRTNITEVKSQKGATASGVAVNAIVATEDTRSVAALVTTVKARLDNFDGAATIEEAYLALADATTGLKAQYTVKVTAGGAVAGFGLAATNPVGGTPSSAFIIAADKFAVVAPGYSGGLTNSPSFANIPFGVDASGVYINGTVRINAGGAAIEDGIEGPPGPAGATGAPGATGATGARGATRTIRTVSGLGAWSDAEANAAIAALGFSPVVRDEVTLRNSDSAPTYLETRYWSGFAWASIGVSINGNLLVSGTITSDKIGASAITADKITTGAITADKVSSGAITADKIGASAVTADKLSAGAVTADKINAGAVTADKLSAGAVTADKINAGAITSDKIGTNTLTAATINTTGAIRATSSLSVSGGATKASIVGYNTLSGGDENGVYGHSAVGAGVYGACASSVGGSGVQGSGYYGGTFTTTNVNGSAVFANNPFGGTALTVDGKLQWGSVPAYPAPTNTGTKYLRDNGTWSEVADSGALGGHTPDKWLRYIAVDATARTFSTYMRVEANGGFAYIPLYT